ncbi:hypothetical protein [Acrocarpospora catenulata]|uniref:hypothetical protein n=1 Tax=Acrocarpospora catenulata TaxID=2836182 RepID=UPI001BD94959|nr:hypothetical protein [Acrocarpospora catenulata]
MPNAMPNPSHQPVSPIDLYEVHRRMIQAEGAVAGYRSVTPGPETVWAIITASLADVGPLTAEVTALRTEIGQTRLTLANLRAAAHATLAGADDGESDPLWYLRDELTAQAATATVPDITEGR